MAFSELNDSSGSFSYIIPSSDQDMDDVTLGKLLTEAHRGQADYCNPEGVSVCQSSSSVVFDRAGKPAWERCRSINWFWCHEKHVQCSQQVFWNTQAEKVVDRSGKLEERGGSNAQIRTLLEEQTNFYRRILRENCHHELQAAHAEEERRILREELWRQQMVFREIHQQSHTEMNYENSRVLPSIRPQDRSSSRTRTLFWNYQAEYKNYKMKYILWTILRTSRMLNQFAGEIPVTSRPVSFPPHPIPEGLLRPSFVSPCRKEAPPSIWDTHGISGNVFANPDAFSSAPYPQELNPSGTTIEEPRFTCLQRRKVKDQNKIEIWDASLDRQPEFQSSLVRETLQRIMGQTNNDCRFLISTSTSSLHQQPSLAERWGSRPCFVLVHNSLRKQCNGSKKWSWLIQWVNWDLRHLLVVFQCHWTKSIHHSHFKRRISLEEQKAQKQDRFFRGRQIAYLIYDYFRVIGSHDSVENYADLFTVSLRNDDIQEFDSKWDGILLSMTKIPHDDILEGLYKLRIRESDKLKTVLQLYDLETYQKKLEPDYHRLKTMVKRSMEQEIRKKILGTEMEILRRTPWSRIREQHSVYKEFLEIVGNGKPTDSVWKETIAVSATIRISVEKLHHQISLRILSCSRVSENHREPEVPWGRSPSGRTFRWPCKDYVRGTWK